MNCGTCQAANPDTSRFCGSCGSRLSAEQPSGVRKRATILFCDVVGSSEIGELLDPEALQSVMARYFSEMRSVLQRHGGTVEKFIGDAVMAVFGVPVTHEDDALRAVSAALEMCEAVSRLSADLSESLRITLEIRIGINTGEVVVGDPSTGHTFVAGDAVNTAARLQQAAGHGQVVIADSTHHLVAPYVTAEPMEPLELKGKAGRHRAWLLVRLVERDAWTAFDEARPFVGRDQHLRLLRQVLERAFADGSCCLCTVFGEPGIGKSRLVHELVRTVPAEFGGRALIGHCLAYGSQDSLAPIVEMIGEVADPGRADSIAQLRPSDRRLAQAAEVIARGLVGGLPIHSTEETWWAVRTTFEAISRDGPLIAVFEDLQWAKPALLDLIEHLADWCGGQPLVLLCLARPDLLDHRPAWGGGKVNAVSLLLPPLSGDECLQLLGGFGEVTAHAAVPAERLRGIVRVSGGNPLYLEQMAMSGSAWDDGDPVIPPTVEGVIAAALDRLPATERVVLERAAVIGHEFRLDHLALLAEIGDATLSQAAEALRRRSMIEPLLVNGGPPRHRFRSITIREMAYRGMSKRTRADLHLRLAELLDVGDETQTSEAVGTHLELAHRNLSGLSVPPDQLEALALRAAAHLGRAASRSMSRFDAGPAADLLDRAVALYPVGHSDRCDALTRLGEALMAADDGERAAGVLEQLLHEARGDARMEAYARLYLATLRPGETGIDELRVAAEAAAVTFAELRDERGLAAAWLRLSQAHAAEGRYAAAGAILDRALPLVLGRGSQLEQAQVLGGLAMALWQGPEPVAAAVARCQSLLDAVPGESRAIRAAVSGPLSILLAMAGRFEEARRLAAATEDAVSQIDNPSVRATAPVFAANVEALEGRHEAAEERLRTSCRAFQRSREGAMLSWTAGQLAHVLVELGRDDEAMEFAELSEHEGSDADAGVRAGWKAAMALVLSRRGAWADALELSRSAIDDASETDSPDVLAATMLARSRVLAASGLREQAGEAAREAVERFSAKGNVVEAARARAVLAEVAP